MHRLCLLAALLVPLGLATALAQEARVHVGVLTCTADDSLQQPGRAAGIETVQMTCGFKPADTGVEERYVGALHQRASGRPAGGKRVLVWAVIGPGRSKMKPGLLTQEYALAAPLGGGAPALVGATKQDIVLQPETTGDVITGVELKLATTPA